MAKQSELDRLTGILAVIRQQYVAHRTYEEAKEELFVHASFAPPGTVIILIGPSRVGKTRAAKAVFDRLTSDKTGKQYRTIWATAANPDRGRFSMKHLTLLLLTSLHHPLHATPSIDSDLRYAPRTSATEPTLRRAAEDALTARGTRWVFLDEAHHVVSTHKHKMASNYLDSIKTLGDASKIVFVWITGYDMISEGFASGHLNGRMRIIHFPRYTQSAEDIDEFCTVLASLSVHLPFANGRSLLDFRSSLYESTFGGIGALFTWTEAALSQMVAKGDHFLKPSHFSATRYEAQKRGLADEIKYGEAVMKQVEVLLDSDQIAKQPEQPLITPKPIHVRAFQRTPRRNPTGRRS